MSLTAGKFESDGTLTAGSMSATIERALNELVQVAAGEDPIGRRKVALAIARGVIKHLGENAGAVTVTVPNTQTGQLTHSQAAAAVDLGGWS